MIACSRASLFPLSRKYFPPSMRTFSLSFLALLAHVPVPSSDSPFFHSTGIYTIAYTTYYMGNAEARILYFLCIRNLNVYGNFERSVPSMVSQKRYRRNDNLRITVLNVAVYSVYKLCNVFVHRLSFINKSYKIFAARDVLYIAILGSRRRNAVIDLQVSSFKA